MLMTQDNVIICDPEDEYSPLVNRLGGQVVRLSPSSTDYLNPVSYTHLDVYKRQLLDRKGYRIKSLNLINFKKSMRYNPLAYIRSEKDILKLVNALILNTKGEGEKSSEDFWVKAERLYYSCLLYTSRCV